VFRFVVLTASFNQFSRDIAGDFKSFRNRAPLGDEALEFMGGRQIHAFGKFFDLNRDGQFHIAIIALKRLDGLRETRGGRPGTWGLAEVVTSMLRGRSPTAILLESSLNQRGVIFAVLFGDGLFVPHLRPNLFDVIEIIGEGCVDVAEVRDGNLATILSGPIP